MCSLVMIYLWEGGRGRGEEGGGGGRIILETVCDGGGGNLPGNDALLATPLLGQLL